MEFFEVVSRRRSVRSYSPKQVPEETILRLMEAARWAPSWRNGQCWEFIVVRDKDKVAALNRGLLGMFIAAPLYVVACGDPRRSGVRNGQYYYLVDVAIATEHFVLAATAEGLGNMRIVALTPLGYEKGSARGTVVEAAVDAAVGRRSRRRVAEFVHWDRY